MIRRGNIISIEYNPKFRFQVISQIIDSFGDTSKRGNQSVAHRFRARQRIFDTAEMIIKVTLEVIARMIQGYPSSKRSKRQSHTHQPPSHGSTRCHWLLAVIDGYLPDWHKATLVILHSAAPWVPRVLRSRAAASIALRSAARARTPQSWHKPGICVLGVSEEAHLIFAGLPRSSRVSYAHLQKSKVLQPLW